MHGIIPQLIELIRQILQFLFGKSRPADLTPYTFLKAAPLHTLLARPYFAAPPGALHE